MSSPYPLAKELWPIGVLLILMCAPRPLRTWILTRLKWLGLAIGILLLLPYLIA